MQFRNENAFFSSSAGILLLTAAAKVYSAAGDAKILSATDELLNLRYWFLMVALGVLEVLVATYLIVSHHPLRRSVLLLWLTANFMTYHFGNHLFGLKTCPCLGTLGGRLPYPYVGSRKNFLEGCILFWFIGSFYILWRAWIYRQETKVRTIDTSHVASTPSL